MKELKNNLFWIGALDKDLRVFDIIMRTEYGTTYNAYLLKSNGKAILFETVKENFFEDYINKITSCVDIQDIEYLIVNHTEPDHSGSIAKLLDINPNITIIGTVGALIFLKEILNRDFRSQRIASNITMELCGKNISFFPMPNLHWPDTMFTYIPDDKVVFTCDSFGAHYCCDSILRSMVDDDMAYMSAAKYYFDNILAPFKQPYMLNGIKKIEELDIDMICTGHGPVLDTRIDELLNYYKQWCLVKKHKQDGLIVIPYVSAYGYTELLAQSVAKGIEKAGAPVKLYDLVNADKAEVLADIDLAPGVIFGTPTILGDALPPIWDMVNSLIKPIHSGKVVSAFGSYGWSGEGVGNIIDRLKQIGMRVEEGFKVRFKPTEEDLSNAFNFGEQFAEIVLMGIDKSLKIK